MTADSDGGSRPLDPFAYLFAVALGAPMLVRRRLPVAVLAVTFLGVCAYYIAKYPPIGLALPLGGALYVAARAGRLRWAVGAATAIVGLSLWFRIQRGGEDLRYMLLFDTLLTVAVMAASIALGDSHRSKAMWRAELQRTHDQEAWRTDHEARQRVAAERARIARELHDSIGHGLSVVSLHADVALESGDLGPKAAEAVGQIRRAGRQSLSELRTAVAVLRSPDTVTAPTLADVNELARHLETAGIGVIVDVRGDLALVPPGVSGTAYRIVQEALTNAVRHSHCDEARVALAVSDGRLDIEVADDGIGLPEGTPPALGHGIRGMTERAAELGGTLTTHVRTGSGFSVRAVLPLAGS